MTEPPETSNTEGQLAEQRAEPTPAPAAEPAFMAAPASAPVPKRASWPPPPVPPAPPDPPRPQPKGLAAVPATVSATTADSPEIVAGAAFAGGFLVALILKRLAR